MQQRCTSPHQIAKNVWTFQHSCAAKILALGTGLSFYSCTYVCCFHSKCWPGFHCCSIEQSSSCALNFGLDGFGFCGNRKVYLPWIDNNNNNNLGRLLLLNSCAKACWCTRDEIVASVQLIVRMSPSFLQELLALAGILVSLKRPGIEWT